jgi:acetate kinase
MNLLVLNSGSGSHKCSMFQVGTTLSAQPLEPIWKAVIMATDPGSSSQDLSLTIEVKGRKKERERLFQPIFLPENRQSIS